jgi:molybdate transport system substrate-binding protein
VEDGMGLRSSLRTTSTLTLWLVPLLLWSGAVAGAAEIKVLAGSAVTPVMLELIPKFEQLSGHKVLFDFDGAIGAMTDRLLKGEVADVAIVSGEQIDLLERQGKVVTGSRTDIAKVGVGLFVRKGASRPEISSIEAFRRAMLTAKSIGYNDPATGAPVGIYLIELFERMGIAAEMQAKTTVFKQRSERFEAIARGDVEIGFNQISEIVATPDVDLVGPLPAPFQHITLFASGIVACGNEHDAGGAFVRFITSPASMAIWRAKGFEAP